MVLVRRNHERPRALLARSPLHDRAPARLRTLRQRRRDRVGAHARTAEHLDVARRRLRRVHAAALGAGQLLQGRFDTPRVGYARGLARRAPGRVDIENLAHLPQPPQQADLRRECGRMVLRHEEGAA